MSLRSALFFSSKRGAYYSREKITKDDTRFYHLRVWITSEEYTPLFSFGTAGPYYRDVFHITVSRKKDNTILTPHLETQFYDIESLETLLTLWKIEIDYYWFSEEDTEGEAQEE